MLPIRLTQEGRELVLKRVKEVEPLPRNLTITIICFILMDIIWGWILRNLLGCGSWWFYVRILFVRDMVHHGVVMMVITMILKGEDSFKVGVSRPVWAHISATNVKLGVFEPHSLPGIICGLFHNTALSLVSYSIGGTLLGVQAKSFVAIWIVVTMTNALSEFFYIVINATLFYLDGEPPMTITGQRLVEFTFESPVDNTKVVPEDEPHQLEEHI